MADPRDFLVERISRDHVRASFDCGKAPLNEYLHRYALQNDKRNLSRAFVAIDDKSQVWGYFAISASSVAASAFPKSAVKNLPNYPVPVALITRLAVDSEMRGIGLGARLLVEAFKRIAEALEYLAVRAVVVDALDNEARSFYRKYGFVEFDDEPMRLFLPVETVLAALK